jgi:hypothetical protein
VVSLSLSNRWNVARLTSAISSSPRTKRCSDKLLLSDCGSVAAGIVDADALPASERPNPAAPSAVTATALVVPLVVPFRFADRLIRAMGRFLPHSCWARAESQWARTACECAAHRPVPPGCGRFEHQLVMTLAATATRKAGAGLSGERNGGDYVTCIEPSREMIRIDQLRAPSVGRDHGQDHRQDDRDGRCH